MDMLVSKYENRIKNFVFQMAEKPIVVKKEKEKRMSCREELFAETSDKILSKKGFVFTSYKTDKERIKEHLERQSQLNKYYSSQTDNSYHPHFFSQKNKYNLIQPSMRFKPRTDLERVYDSLKEREVIDSKSLKRQMHKMGLVSQTFQNESLDSDDEENYYNATNYNYAKQKMLEQNEEYKKKMHNKIIEDRKEMIKMRKKYMEINANKRRVDNSEFRNVRPDLHKKTHFKAMENLTMFKTSTMNHNLFKSFSKEDIERQNKFIETKNNFYNTITLNGFYPKQRFNTSMGGFRKNMKRQANTTMNSTNPNSFGQNKGNFSLIGNTKILKDLEITKEIANSNPLLFNMNFNSIKADTGTFNVSNEQLDILRKIAFEKAPPEEELSTKELKDLMKTNEVYDEYKKEQNIVIDGEEFKKTELDKIADKVLNKCNWNEKKQKYTMRGGNGKLMFTNGLTLKEFEMKYGLLP